MPKNAWNSVYAAGGKEDGLGSGGSLEIDLGLQMIPYFDSQFLTQNLDLAELRQWRPPSLISLSHQHLVCPFVLRQHHLRSYILALSLSRLAQPASRTFHLKEHPRTQSNIDLHSSHPTDLCESLSRSLLRRPSAGAGADRGAARSFKPAHPTPLPHSQGGVERPAETPPADQWLSYRHHLLATTMHVFVRSLEGQSLSFGECAAPPWSAR